MYKCGWNGCEKAYGTLNHLNAHVTMQSHGQKRTPEGKYKTCSLISASLFVALATVFVGVARWRRPGMISADAAQRVTKNACCFPPYFRVP